jgi:hypothetical protein
VEQTSSEKRVMISRKPWSAQNDAKAVVTRYKNHKQMATYNRQKSPFCRL